MSKTLPSAEIRPDTLSPLSSLRAHSPYMCDALHHTIQLFKTHKGSVFMFFHLGLPFKGAVVFACCEYFAVMSRTKHITMENVHFWQHEMIKYFMGCILNFHAITLQRRSPITSWLDGVLELISFDGTVIN